MMDCETQPHCSLLHKMKAPLTVLHYAHGQSAMAIRGGKGGKGHNKVQARIGERGWFNARAEPEK